MAYYNPKAYVPGGATVKKAKAIVSKGKQKPKKTPAGHAPAGAPTRSVAPYAGYLTPAQVMAQSRAEAQKILNATVAPLQKQSARLPGQYTAAGEALAKELEPLSGQINSLYSNAALAQKDLAGGYSQAVQGVLNADEAAGAGTLARLGLPALGAQPNAAVGDVIYGLGGSLPAQTLGGMGTAQAATFAALPAGARLQAQANTFTAQQKIRDDIAALRAKQPEIYQSLLESGRGYQDTLADNAINARAQWLYEQEFGVKKLGTAGLDAYGNPIPVDPKDAAKNKTNAATKKAAAIKFRNSETADAIADMVAWVEGKLKPQKGSALGEPIKAGTVVKQIGTKRVTVQLYRTKDGKTTDDPTDPNVAIETRDIETPGSVNYVAARDYIRGSLHTRLDRFGWSKKQINEMAARVLSQLKINPPKGKPRATVSPYDVAPGGGYYPGGAAPGV